MKQGVSFVHMQRVEDDGRAVVAAAEGFSFVSALFEELFISCFEENSEYLRYWIYPRDARLMFW